jgi:hypothetical protein
VARGTPVLGNLLEAGGRRGETREKGADQAKTLATAGAAWVEPLHVHVHVHVVAGDADRRAATDWPLGRNVVVPHPWSGAEQVVVDGLSRGARGDPELVTKDLAQAGMHAERFGNVALAGGRRAARCPAR